MKDIKEILYRVEKGEMTSKEAADGIRSLFHGDQQIKYAKKIKIRVHDKENNKKISLPAIPIWLIEKIVLVGVRLTIRFYKKDDKNIKEKKKIDKVISKKIEFLRSEELDIEDLKEIFSALKKVRPCKLVDINDEDVLVEIYMI